MIKVIVILLIISFIRYASKAEQISINEWLNLINTRRNRILVLFLLFFPIIHAAIQLFFGAINPLK